MLLPRRCFVLIFLFLVHASAYAQPGGTTRFFDAATGYGIDPGELEFASSIDTSNQDSPAANGHALTVRHRRYRPLTYSAAGSDGHTVGVWLEPLEPPEELSPNRIATLRQSDAMLLLGYVTSAESGAPLNGVGVTAGQSRTQTDERGYFELRAPLRETVQGQTALVFEHAGFVTHEIQAVQCWPRGDLTYLVRLKEGHGRESVDENANRRLSWTGQSPGGQQQLSPVTAHAVAESQPPSSSNLTVRVPGTIRVLRQDGIIDYVSLELYCRRSLVREWIAGWSAYNGGLDSLKAGAVAVRTYAIGFVHTPRTNTYDICATTSCQVYGTTTSASTDTAVSQTAGMVMINSSGNISRGLTEYSSENNSLGSSCGDGFTAPTGGCLSDPVCSGEPRFGHGRGMCQWGSVKWATGLKFPGNDFSDTTATNGFPRRDWVWILQHYYPALRLVRGTSLVVGDNIKVLGTNALIVQMCADGGISDGVNCSVVGARPSLALGSIIAGPVQILADGFGFRWWKVQWSDGMVGWSPENWLQRVIPLPTTPASLAAAPVSSTQISLTWSNTSALDQGFKIEAAASSTGLWLVVTEANPNAISATVADLDPDTTYHFRVRAFNVAGDSPPSNVATATTRANVPELAPVPDQAIDEDLPVTFAIATIEADAVISVTDFENFATTSVGGSVLFRQPRFSGSSSALLDPTPDVSIITDDVPPLSGSRALAVSFSYTNTAAPWLRLTTFNAASLANPVIDLSARLRFDIYTDRDLLLAVGIRESTNSIGDPLGSNGGTFGGIEWVGVTNKNGTAPQPSRRIPAGSWQTVDFDFADESITNFTGGNSHLSTASGLAVLEHLALVPTTGSGVHNVYLDNFAVVYRRPLVYSLDSAPAGATIDPGTGMFSWTPTEAQGPGSYPVTVRVVADGNPLLADTDMFTIVVRDINQPPLLGSIPNRTIHAGTTLAITNAATDPDIPANALTFELLPPAAEGALINASTGEFLFTPLLSQANTTNIFTVRVQDNGAPPRSATNSFAVIVLPPPRATALFENGETHLRWSAIPGMRYVIQFKDDLSVPSWTDILPALLATGVELQFTHDSSTPTRFYRVQVVE